MTVGLGSERGGDSILSGSAPEPKGPQTVREKCEVLNRPRPWDVGAHVSRLLGKLDLKAGATVVVVAEVLNAAAGDSIAEVTGLPYPGGALAFVLPALAGFFHRKEKGKASQTSSGEPATASTPQEVAAAVSDARKSTPRKLWQRAKDTLG